MTAVMRIRVPSPPSANRYWRSAPGKGMVPSKEALEYKRELRRLLAQHTPIFGDCVVRLRWFRQRKCGDLDGVLKVLFDALEGIAFLDDKQVAQLHASRHDDQPANPAVELEVIGERFATRAEADAFAAKKLEANRRRKQTIAANRAAAAAPTLLGRARPAFVFVGPRDRGGE